jgi:hypothetical protein
MNAAHRSGSSLTIIALATTLMTASGCIAGDDDAVDSADFAARESACLDAAEDAAAPQVVGVPVLELWPPDRALHWITPEDCASSVVDDCSDELEITFTWGTSDEIADPDADDKFVPERDIVDLGCDGVGVRAEADADREGRVYTLGFEATDDAGNTVEGSCVVVVPRDPNDLTPVEPKTEAYRLTLDGCR